MERYEDDERREIQKLPSVILNDGREYTQKFVFESFIRNKELDDRNLRKALYLTAVRQPFKIIFSSEEDSRQLDVESLFKRRNVVKDRSRYDEAKIEIDGIIYDSNNESLYNALEANGTSVQLNSH